MELQFRELHTHSLPLRFSPPSEALQTNQKMLKQLLKLLSTYPTFFVSNAKGKQNAPKKPKHTFADVVPHRMSSMLLINAIHQQMVFKTTLNTQYCAR